MPGLFALAAQQIGDGVVWRTAGVRGPYAQIVDAPPNRRMAPSSRRQGAASMTASIRAIASGTVWAIFVFSPEFRMRWVTWRLTG